jgi:hypothetical protein
MDIDYIGVSETIGVPSYIVNGIDELGLTLSSGRFGAVW